MIVNKHRVLQWVERLESGDIPQGYGKLHYVDGSMCCLGVATELARESGVPLERTVSSGLGQQGPYYIYGRELTRPTAGFLHRDVQVWLGIGIGSDDPVLDFDDEVAFRASDANDNKGYAFVEIAAAIRRTYLDNDDPCCDGVACPDKVSTAK